MLREAEYRSTYPLPYWNLALLRWLVPRQRRCQDALRLINTTLDSLIAESKRLVGIFKSLPALAILMWLHKSPMQASLVILGTGAACLW